MALLRASSEVAGVEVDLSMIGGAPLTGWSGIPHGDELVDFVTEAIDGGSRLDDARAALRGAVGDEGVLEAAATVGAFSGLVRVADATGIQLDTAVESATREDRQRLGIDGFAGADNTHIATSTPSRAVGHDVRALFDVDPLT